MADAYPQEAEEIQLHYELPSGKKVWWPATVEDIVPCNEEPGVIAYASVVFHAAHGYATEQCRAQIRRNRTIKTESRIWTESTWRRPDEPIEGGADEEKKSSVHATQDVAPKRNEPNVERVTRGSSKRPPTRTRSHRNSNRNVEVPNDSSCTDRIPQTIQGQSTMVVLDEETESHPKRKKRESNTSETKQAVPVRESSVRTDIPADLLKDLQDMRERLGQVERKQLTDSKCNHMELITERVHALRTLLGDEVLKNSLTIPRPGTSGNNVAYGHIFAREVVRYQTKIDYKMFCYALEDIKSSTPE